MTYRALITGAAGFAGSRLHQLLSAEGWDVVAATTRDSGEGLVCDVTQLEDIEKLLDEAGELTHIFHLAAIAFVPAANKNPLHAMDVNLNGAIRLLHALDRRKFQGRFLNIGSSDTYGPPRTLPITEDHPLNPVNAYAISKAAADQYCGYFAKASGLDILRMRPFNHSGPGQSSDFFLSSCARQIAAIERGQAEPVLKVGNLEGKRDFTHVDDVARAFMLAALHGKSSGIYNVCSGKSVGLREALDRLIHLSEAEIRIEADPERFRPTDVPEVLGSPERIIADCGWERRRSFDDLLEGLLNGWRDALACQAEHPV